MPRIITSPSNQHRIPPRLISDLFNHQGNIYVYCSSPLTEEIFAWHLTQQGFHFGDGASPARRGIDSLMCVHPDFTICYCGFVCHLQCGGLDNPVYVQEDCFDGCTRVDYARFLSGVDDYVIQGRRPAITTTAAVEYW